MKQIFKILTCFLAVIGVCTAALVCFILIYPIFNGDFSSIEAESTTNVSEEKNEYSAQTSSPGADSPDNTAIEGEEFHPQENSSILTPADISDNNNMPQSSAAPTPTAQKEEIPIEYQSALNRADNYCDLMHMSKEAIYDQLISEYENVSPEAARYAVNHVKADWNDNALQKARVYSDTMYMSQTAIYEQLISEHGEKFTESEAQYAMDHLEADWNSNALHKAREYRNSTNMTKSAIYDQLISEHGDKFAPEEASYAIKNLK